MDYFKGGIMAMWHGFHGWEDDASDEAIDFNNLNLRTVLEEKDYKKFVTPMLGIICTPSSMNGYFYKAYMGEINKIEDDEDFTQGHS